MEHDNTETPQGGLDRRKLIKRAGIVTAGVAAWSTPMVSSLASAAHAAGSQATRCNSCGTFAICGQSPNAAFGACICFQLAADPSACACLENQFCDRVQACTTNADCPAGSTCIAAGNGCGQSVCLVNCDNTTGARSTGQLRGSGMTASGRVG